MLIVHVITGLETGGAEHMLRRLVSSYGDQGEYRHHVISLRSKGTIGPQIEAAGISVEALHMNTILRGPSVLAKLIARLRILKPDIVHCWMYHADLVGGLAAAAAGIRARIWSIRATDLTPDMGVSKATFLVRRVCAGLSGRIPSRIIYVGTEARLRHEAIGYDPAKAIIIPNGYDVPPKKADIHVADDVRGQLGLGAGDILFGCAARYSPVKDYPGLIRAFAALAGENPRLRLLLIGRDVDKDNAELGGLVDALGMNGRIFMLGDQKKPLSFMAAMDVFVLNSRIEGFPNVVAEAMAAGTACIATDVGEVANLMGDTGIIVPPNDPPRLQQAMREMIAAGPDGRAAIGDKARQRLIATYGMATIRERYDDLYTQLAREAKAPRE